MVCASCGGFDHKKSSNKLCPNYKPWKPRKAWAQQIMTAGNLNPATESLPVETITETTNEADKSTKETTRTDPNVATINRGEKFSPTYIKVGENKSYTPVVTWGQGISNLP